MKQRRIAKAYVRQVSEDKEGLLTSVVGSTAAVDRYGEIIDQASWDLKHFKKNPVILWSHNMTFGESRPPIGKAIKVKVEDDKLVFDIQFDMADPFAADIFRKYKEGFLSAFSVGFIPHKIQRSDDSSEHPILIDNELLELSAVPVPANPEALNQLQLRSFKAKSWDSLYKEAEKEDHPDPDDDNPTPPAKTGDEDVSDETVEKIAAKVTANVLPELTKSITEIVKGVKASQDVGGDGNPPEKDKLGVQGTRPSNKTVAVIRTATKMLQGALAEANAAAKASR